MTERLCDLCGAEPADLKYREIAGWEEIRKGGGANKIIARRESPRRIGAECMWRLKHNVSLRQGMLS